MQKILAKPISHAATQRSLNNVKAIVIHYTGNKGDRAEGNALYFKNGNTREAGAHLFIDREGVTIMSVEYKFAAWSVGGKKYTDCGTSGGGRYYGTYTNANTVSIELCDIKDQYPSAKQIEATKAAIKDIRKSCPNATKVIRHFDVNGKHCPVTMMDAKTWEKFLADIGEGGGAPATTPAKQASHYYPKYSGKSGSIVEALVAVGEKNTSLTHRKTIAAVNGITGYSGTAAQNTSLLALLKSGKLKRP